MVILWIQRQPVKWCPFKAAAQFEFFGSLPEDKSRAVRDRAVVWERRGGALSLSLQAARTASERSMDKREFLKASGGFIAAGMMKSAFGEQHAEARTNWAGNLTFSTDQLHTPTSLDEVREVVKQCAHLRALGTRHSFNAIADSKYNQVSLKKFDRIDLDEKARTVTVGAGVRYGDLATVIDQRGFAVHNLASLPHISVAG